MGVMLKAASGSVVSSTRANTAGEFELKALSGQSYTLVAGVASVTLFATDVPEAVTIVSAPYTPAGTRSPVAPPPIPLYPPRNRFRIVFPLWPDVNPQSSIR
jgi:hypothetical protein